MALVGLVVVLAALLGVAIRRRLPDAPDSSALTGWPLAVAGGLGQLIGVLIANAMNSALPYLAGSVTATVLVAAFVLRNRALHGMPLVALGLALNALAIGVNGAMPVSVDAARSAGVDLRVIADGLDPRHALAGPDTALRLITDRIPVPLPWLPEVVSAGDVLIAAGLGLYVVMAMTTGARVSRRPDGEGVPASRRFSSCSSASCTRSRWCSRGSTSPGARTSRAAPSSPGASSC